MTIFLKVKLLKRSLKKSFTGLYSQNCKLFSFPFWYVFHLFCQAFIDEGVRDEHDIVGFSFLGAQDSWKLASEEKLHGLIRTAGKAVIPHVVRVALVFNILVIQMLEIMSYAV